MEALINSPLFNICNVNLHKASHDNGTEKKKKNNKHKGPLTNYKPNSSPFRHKVPKHSIILLLHTTLYTCQKMECHILWNVQFQYKKKEAFILNDFAPTVQNLS